MFDVAQKVIWCRQKGVDIAQKSISCWQKQDDAASKHSHKKRKDSLETRSVLLIFSLEREISGWPYRAYIKTARNGDFSEELLSENDFKAVLVTFCCYEHGAKASEAVQNIATDQQEYRECSLCVI